jgi:hypothetical protein
MYLAPSRAYLLENMYGFSSQEKILYLRYKQRKVSDVLAIM